MERKLKAAQKPVDSYRPTLVFLKIYPVRVVFFAPLGRAILKFFLKNLEVFLGNRQ